MWLRRSEPRPSNVIFFPSYVVDVFVGKHAFTHAHRAVVRERPGDSIAPLLPLLMEVWSVG